MVDYGNGGRTPLEDLSDWLSHPLVAAAVRRSGWDASADAAQLLSALSEVLNEIEDKVPGLSFTQLLDGVRPDRTADERAEIARRLCEGGMELEDADAALGIGEPERHGNLPVKSSMPRAIARQMLALGETPERVSEATGLTVSTIKSIRSFEGLGQRSKKTQAIEMIEAGASNVEIRNTLGLSAASVRTYRSRLNKGVLPVGTTGRSTERCREIADKYAELQSVNGTAKFFGVARNTVRAAVAHMRRLESAR